MSNSLTQERDIIVGIAGMTHLGLISATAIAAKGFRVVGYDPDDILIANLKSYCLPVEEPQLKDLLKENGDRQTFTTSVTDLEECDVIYIAVDIPTTKTNESDLLPIQTLLNKIIPSLDDQAVLVILSQVSPGFTRQLPIHSNQLFYQVETLVFGQAIQRASHPERFIIGCSDPKQPLPSAYHTLLEAFDCPLLLMRYESAELAKIAINLFLVSSVLTTNTLAEISSAVGADWDEIVPALRLDKRIGPHAYLKPGLGIAGGNLERDMRTTIKIGNHFNSNVNIIEEWFHYNEYQKEWVYRNLQAHVFSQCPDPNIAILGLAYKANTHSIKNAPSLVLLQRLAENKVKVHDPVVTPEVIPHACFGSDIEQTIKNADVLIILTPWMEYCHLNPVWIKQQMRGNWIIDPHRILNHDGLIALGFHIITLGCALKTAKEVAYV